MTPGIRIQKCNSGEVNRDGDYVLYWMIANRRVKWNYSLDRAIEWAIELGKPLIILEALRCDYNWASARLHRFVIDGMVENACQLKNSSIVYYPYLESEPGAGKGLLAALSKKACLVITDDFPCFFIPRMLAAAAQQIPVVLEKVDSNGLLPMRAGEKVFSRAFDFRRFLQKNLPEHLLAAPSPDPVATAGLPKCPDLAQEIESRWPRATGLEDYNLSKLPIDHEVGAAPLKGGPVRADQRLDHFIQKILPGYGEHRNQPEKAGTSGFSPFLHFGHLSVHDIFSRIVKAENWNPGRLSPVTNGSRNGWWGMSSAAESFLDELITWRELGYNMCWQRSDYAGFNSLPGWARSTLTEHADDPRDYVYSLHEFEKAVTHDPLWNAAQTQLVSEGIIHNYLRMLWGKKILQWSASPQTALQTMIELNNKYALDGRNPNSYTGIFWVLGRYDRAWGPERQVFGKIRYMSSRNTARKIRVKNYIAKYSPEGVSGEYFMKNTAT